MKVLWFTNVPPSAMIRASGMNGSGVGGHWIIELLRHVREKTDFELGIVTAFPGLSDKSFEEDGVTYFPIGQPAKFPAFTMRQQDLDRCVEIIEEFRPDLLHVHGSERFYGEIKAAGLTNVPTVLSIQGLLGPVSNWRNYFGALSPIDILRSIRLIELPLKLGLAWQYLNMKNAVRRETRILSAVEGLLGRTDWDQAYSTAVNSSAKYLYVDEIIRAAFSDASWKVDHCERHTLIFTNAGHPLRGTENLFGAVALLRDEFPDIRLRLAGTISERSGYGRFLRHKLKSLGIGENIEFLGFLNETEMVHELQHAHIFTITSYIENSPNSLAEAMLVGLPCIASFVGGIPSMVTDGETGLLFPVNDVQLLAHKIRKIFNNDDLATRLGGNARQSALKRHDPELIIRQLERAYGEVPELLPPKNMQGELGN